MNFAITPEMLLGALIVSAIALLFVVIAIALWVRSALRFGRDFQSFKAYRGSNRINVEAVFDDMNATARPKKPGFWASMFPPADRETTIELASEQDK